jgi:hypothetical protein
MAVYVVIADGPNPKLNENINSAYPGDEHYTVNESQWFIASDKLASTISSELGIESGGVGGRAVVFRLVGPGAGWHAKSLWAWFSLKGLS